jgi:phosphomannomutase
MSFDHTKTIYRDYDIRGKYGEEITDEEVYKIGKAVVTHFSAKKIAIGRDIRPSADALFDALSKGITEMGAHVVDLGLCTTPMSYFVCGSTDVDATVMITASHMPSEYNGLKITVDDAKPVTGDVLQILKEIVGTHTFSMESTHGEITTHALQPDWIEQFKKRHDLSGSGFSIVVDPANMIGALEIDTFKAFEPELTVHSIYETFDHTSPNHEANPIKHETLIDLAKEVVYRKATLGVAFDGDADRVGFVDEKGNPIASDIIGILLAEHILGKYEGETIVYDIRSTRALKEEIERLGGVPVTGKVGHTNIKTMMRKHDAALGVELSGHFFFRESYYCEGGALPVFYILELIKQTGKPLSELAQRVKKYAQSGEINSKVTLTPVEIYTALKETFSDGEYDFTDGLSITYPTWWCNVRPSANDPVMRLNLEAVDLQTMEMMRDKVLRIIRGDESLIG